MPHAYTGSDILYFGFLEGGLKEVTVTSGHMGQKKPFRRYEMTCK